MWGITTAHLRATSSVTVEKCPHQEFNNEMHAGFLQTEQAETQTVWQLPSPTHLARLHCIFRVGKWSHGSASWHRRLFQDVTCS